MSVSAGAGARPLSTSARRLSHSLAQAGHPTRCARIRGDRRIGVVPGELQVDVAVELREAILAAELGPARSQEPRHPRHPRDTNSARPVAAPVAWRWSFVPLG